MQLIEQIRGIYDNYMFKTEILAASRSPHHAHHRLCRDRRRCHDRPTFSAIKGLLKHPLTDSGLEKFLADHAKAAASVSA